VGNATEARRGPRRVGSIGSLALGLAIASLVDGAHAAPRIVGPGKPVPTAKLGPPGRWAEPAADQSVMPRGESPAVVRDPTENAPPRGASGPRSDAHPSSTAGWSRDLVDPAFEDRRRRVPQTARPEPFGFRLQPGERFKFDVTFAGNPAGLAEASIVAVEPDPRGAAPEGSPTLKIVGHARTSGIISLLATVTDDITTILDAHTGAPISSTNILDYAGWSPQKYKHRITEQAYDGRGYLRVTDTKDGKAKKKRKRVPVDTFDPMSSMAWVRTLDLEPGDRAKAHVVDGTTLMRVEIEAVGRQAPPKMPSIVRALELEDEDIMMLRGTLTRVDEYDQPIPGKRTYKLRAWVSTDRRRIPLVMESDMWVGSLRLVLSSYDPPESRSAPGGNGTSDAGAP
jgi:hypothetical protein